ncbi:MAG: hypothetical protein K1X92_08320 [Bacteroidia bacterium]|nr:hypothetical protein [Bacteroidia bacterium]
MHFRLFLQILTVLFILTSVSGCGKTETRTGSEQSETATTIQNNKPSGKSTCGGIQTGNYVLVNDPKIRMTIAERGEKFLVIVFIDNKEYQDNLYVCDSEMLVSINQLICIRNVGGNKIKTGNHFTGESFFYTKVDSM